MTRFVSLAITFALAAVSTACGQTEAPPKPVAAAPEAPRSLTVAADTAGVVFRYRDPDTGAVASATTVEAIPAAARGVVVIYHPTEAPPAGADFVANLNAPPPWEAKAVSGFAFAAPPPAVAGTEAAAASASKEVVLFATDWCGYCKKARKFFQNKGVPFTEYDIENDRKAEPRLAELTKKAGVPRDSLSGVPIIFIGGKLMRGWDEGEAMRMLGKAR